MSGALEIEEQEAPYPRAMVAWWVVVVMFFASVISVIDRGILTLVVDPIRTDLGISDIQMSLLLGLAFGVFYAVVGVPLGLIADRLSRRRLLIAGVAVWSLATFMGGFAQGYWHLFASRLLVGLGEAALAPCAVSMIADMFPAKRRGLPVSVYLLGQSIAGGLSLVLTGMVLTGVPAGDLDWVPGIAGMAPWRVALMMAGFLGIPVLIMLFSIREPARRGVKGHPQKQGVLETFSYLGARLKVFAPFYAGFASVVFLAYSMTSWSATYVMRRFAMTPGELGQMQGSATMVLGVIGALGAGVMVDMVARKGPAGGKLLFLSAVALLMAPISCIVLAPDAMTAIIMVAAISLLLPMVGTGMITTLQDMLPNHMHGVGVSLFGVFNTISGQALGPWLVAFTAAGIVSTTPGIALGQAILVTCGPAALLASVLYLVAFLAFRRRQKSETSA